MEPARNDQNQARSRHPDLNINNPTSSSLEGEHIPPLPIRCLRSEQARNAAYLRRPEIDDELPEIKVMKKIVDESEDQDGLINVSRHIPSPLPVEGHGRSEDESAGDFFGATEGEGVVLPKYAWSWRDVNAHPLLTEKGVQNTRNKCYAISTLQLLAHIPPVLKIVEDHRHEDNAYHRQCLACEWTRYMLHVNVRSKDTSFAWFERCFESIWPIVQKGEQEDATEALFHILLKLDYIASSNYPTLTKFVASEDIFGFKIKIERRCHDCNFLFSNNQVHKALNLTFPQDQENTPQYPLPKYAKHPRSKREYDLDELFQHYFQINRFSSICDRCKEEKLVSERAYMLRFPNILLIHILRFNAGSGFINKIDNPVVAPNGLKLGKYATAEGVEADYELSGMLIHSGSNCEKGHYHTIVQKYRQPDEWINLDDHMVGEVKQRFEKQAYLLVYRRSAHAQVDKVYVRDYSRPFDYSSSFLTSDHDPPAAPLNGNSNSKKRERTPPKRESPRRGAKNGSPKTDGK
ncbi:unnamed protein product [Caenorhabditis angaria]|uniref:Ubiquitin carboxyl-terminal hydrolase 36 n=1 Tax=Caenorhabditis angaria TaxID=860376 RepID=A0A9P1NA44_9PELO|nr:unnamed protein product [Caenorhabditis angaria]